MHSGRVIYIEDPIGKIFVDKKYLVTPSVFKLQKWFLYQNGVESNQKSKSDDSGPLHKVTERCEAV